MVCSVGEEAPLAKLPELPEAKGLENLDHERALNCGRPESEGCCGGFCEISAGAEQMMVPHKAQETVPPLRTEGTSCAKAAADMGSIVSWPV